MRVGFVIVALLAATALAAPRGALPLQGARDAPRQMARSLVASRRRMQELSQQVTSQRGHFRGQQDSTTTTAAATTTDGASTTAAGTTTASPAGSGSGSAVAETPLSECENAYITKLIEVFGKCGDAFFDTMFSSIDPDNTTAVQGKADACNSTCLPDLFATTVQFATCDSPLVGEMEFFSNYLQLTCGRNQVGDWCFQSFARLDAWGACFDPDRDTQASCTKTQSCRYRSGGCTMRSSNEQFAIMCNDPCINDYLSFMARYFKTEADGTDQAGDLAEGLDYLCMNANGSYCTLAFDDAEYNETGSYKAIADAFCRNDTRAQCLVVASAVDSAKAEKRASNAFAKCANSTTLSDTDKAECLKTLHGALTSSDAQLTSTQFICATKDNTNTANSVYCGTEIFENLVGNTAFLDCDTANSGGTCTTSCDGTLKAAFNGAGCCAYYYGEFSAKPRLPDARIPEIANGPNTSTWTFESAGIQDRPAFADYSLCTTTFESKGNYTLCVSTSSRQQSTTTKTLQTEVSWEALADTRRRERLRLALKKDIAASIGLSDDAIISDSLSKSSRMLTIRLSKTKTVQKAGTQYVFTIKATTTAKTNAASTLFDSKAKDGLLTTVTSNNQVRPSNCKNCLADGSSAVVLRPLQAKAANGQPVPTRKQANGVPTTTKKGSGNTTKSSNTTVATTKTSSAVAQAAALVVAVAAALLL